MNILRMLWEALGAEGRLYLGLFAVATILVLIEQLLARRFPRFANVLASVRALLPDPSTSLLHAKAALGKGPLAIPLETTAQRPQMPPEASAASAPPKSEKTLPTGLPPGVGGALAICLLFGVCACTAAQLQTLTAGIQLLGQVCDVVSDVSGKDEVEYACQAVDAAAPLVSLIPTASASAPPNAKAGPPLPPALSATARKANRVIVPRAQVPAFERDNRVRR